ncbi:CPBP family glutamic-type intramembrane protease [Streptomyces angustmyceticus]|uniref:CPBP family glutamic-type intramembrane protease n=1 Tax=Streptomyces angustmyceticus TaxID=285578 RepID=UPI0021B01104|nr:CPBP family glutamic-type intramembrane protease [Streptomyces angustmyceticus]
MTTTHGTTPARGSAGRAWGRALLGGIVMAGALGAGNALGEALARLLGADGYARQLLPAVLVSALAVPAVLGLRAVRSVRRLPMGLGPRSAAPLGFLRGLAVTASCAAAVLGAGTALGWVRWSGLDPAALAAFLVSNALVAVLLEALPEEATLRGYAWVSLRDRLGGVVSALGTTVVFLLVPGVSTVVQAGVSRLVGVAPVPMGLSPEGQDPVAYLVLLTVFGLTLVAARTAPGAAPLWTAIGTHVAFLSVNRVVFEGVQRDAGWSAKVAPTHAAVLELGYLAATALVFVVARLVSSLVRARARRLGTRHPSAATAHGVGGWTGGGPLPVPAERDGQPVPDIAWTRASSGVARVRAEGAGPQGLSCDRRGARVFRRSGV